MTLKTDCGVNVLFLFGRKPPPGMDKPELPLVLQKMAQKVKAVFWVRIRDSFVEHILI